MKDGQALVRQILAVMDWLGYTQKPKRMAKAILLGVPVVLARTAVARAIQELT